MGSCVSVHKGKAGGLGLPKFGSKTDRAFVVSESPFKDKDNTISVSTAVDLPIKTFHDFGSKDETFFDSKAWLDSDCEDDFFSVNGDFTPSHGNTPVHHRFSTGSPLVNKTLLVVEKPSPTGKKRLSELFQDSAREELDVGPGRHNINIAAASGKKQECKATILDLLPKSVQTPTFVSVSGTNSASGSERIPNGYALIEKETSMKSSSSSVQCCLPSLVSCRSLSERKKRMTPHCNC